MITIPKIRHVLIEKNIGPKAWLFDKLCCGLHVNNVVTKWPDLIFLFDDEYILFGFYEGTNDTFCIHDSISCFIKYELGVSYEETEELISGMLKNKLKCKYKGYSNMPEVIKFFKQTKFS